MAKYQGNASIPVPAHCCMCVRREELEVRMSPWSRGGSLVPTLPSTTSVNSNFTFVATPQCVNGRWDADGYLTSHRDSGGEACIVMGDILLGHWLYLLITTWVDVYEGAEKWATFSAEDSTGRRGGVSTWFGEERITITMIFPRDTVLYSRAVCCICLVIFFTPSVAVDGGEWSHRWGSFGQSTSGHLAWADHDDHGSARM